MNFRKSKGFTLIELLVVVSIISLLSSIVLASLQDARAKARDTRRLSDLRQISNALQLYLLDNNNVAPTPGAGQSGYHSADPDKWAAFATILSPYISTLPVDPLNGQTIPVTVYKENVTSSDTYRYFYRRLDNHSVECQDGTPDPDCSQTSLYVLDTNFEKRRQGTVGGLLRPVSFFLGVEYPNVADGV